MRRARRAEPVQLALAAREVVHSLPRFLARSVVLASKARLDLLAREQDRAVNNQRPPRADPASRALGEHGLCGRVDGVSLRRLGGFAAAAAGTGSCGGQGLQVQPAVRPEPPNLVS